MLNIALPKGRLGEKVYAMFEKAGYECPSIHQANRKLIFENPEKQVRYFWVKPSDVPIYVERGAADLGIAGKDILLEYEPDIYELMDLGLGKCRMAIAGPKDFHDDGERTLKVATKFTHITADYYASLGRQIDIIRLNGSIEIAIRCYCGYRRNWRNPPRKRSICAGGNRSCKRSSDCQQILLSV